MRAHSLVVLLSVLLVTSLTCLSTPVLDYGHSRYGSTLEDLRRFVLADGSGVNTLLELWNVLPLKVHVPSHTWSYFGDDIEYGPIFWDAVGRLEAAVTEIAGGEVDLFQAASNPINADLTVDYVHSLTWAQFEEYDWGRNGAPRKATLHIRYFTTSETADLSLEIEHALIWLLICGDGNLPWPLSTRRFRTQTTDLSNLDIVDSLPTAADYEMLALALALGDGVDLEELDCGKNLAPVLDVVLPTREIEPYDVLLIDASGTADPEGDTVELRLTQVQGYEEAIVSAGESGGFNIQLPASGDYVFEISASDNQGNTASKRIHLYALGSCPEPIPLQTSGNLIVATHYLSTWGRKNNDWRTQTENIGDRSYDLGFADPRYHPLLGNYDAANSSVGDWHIKMAVENGVNCFLVVSTRPALEISADQSFREGLLCSQYIDKINFCMELNLASWWENDGYFWGIDIDGIVEETVGYYCRNYFNHPSYLRINDSPVLVIYREQVHYGRSGARHRNLFIDKIREVARSYGYELYLVGDVLDSNEDPNWVSGVTSPFESASAYWTTGIPWSFANGIPYVDVTFSENSQSLARQFEFYREFLDDRDTVLAPAIAVGFDNTPPFEIGIDNWLWRQTEASGEEFRELATTALEYVDEETPMLVVYAWNEVHEGGVLEPSHERGYSYLEALRDVVAIEPEGGWPENSLTLAGEIKEPLEEGSHISFIAGKGLGATEEPARVAGCRHLGLAAIDWLASLNEDANPNPVDNFAEIVDGTDGYGDYRGMRWNSPAFTDLSLNALDLLDRKGTESIMLTLAASEPMAIDVVVGVSGSYCGEIWRYAVPEEQIQIGTEPQQFELSYSVFTENPFGDCTDPLPEDALEHIYSIILLPSPQAGELRVYEVAFCGEDIAMAVDEPAAVPQSPEIPTFAIDPDVTLDSVVQIGDGPQELSTVIKFYPNTRRAKPGDTIYWTLDLGDLEGPFTIVPEFNNDMIRESTIQTEDRTITLEYEYTKANLYCPFITITDGDGRNLRLYTANLVCVSPVLEQRTPVGILPPIRSQSAGDYVTGDYVKGMAIHTFDHTLFDSAAGERFIQGELDRIRSLGCNMVFFTCQWFIDGVTSSISEPIYGNAWPACWVGTLSFDALVKLADWAHERGMRVCLRTGHWMKGDHSGAQKTGFSPLNGKLYLDLQTQQKTAYGALCDGLGIELYCLEAENEYFTALPGVAHLIQDVREVYGGLITNSSYNVSAQLSCPYAASLDVLSWSDYYFFTQNVGAELEQEDLSNLFRLHYETEVRPVLDRYQKPGLVMETGVNIQDNSPVTIEKQYRAYLDAFVQLQREHALLFGSAWWTWNLSTPQKDPHAMRGTLAEDILREYFDGLLSDSYMADFGSLKARTLRSDYVLEDFEAGLPEYTQWYQGSDLRLSVEPSSETSQGSCLQMILEPNGSADYRHGFVWIELAPPMDWSGYSSINFSLRSSNENWGLRVGVLDVDGDNFTTLWRIDTRPHWQVVLPATNGWHRISIPLDLLLKPEWDDSGNGRMDWHNVRSWGIGLFFKDHGKQTLWIDDVYLSHESLID